MEASAQNIDDKLKEIDDYEIHHRFREANGCQQSADLNEKLLKWSVGVTH